MSEILITLQQSPISQSINTGLNVQHIFQTCLSGYISRTCKINYVNMHVNYVEMQDISICAEVQLFAYINHLST